MRFLLIDDHVVVRSGLKQILSDLYKPCTIDEAEDGESAHIKLKLHEYDLIILDIKMPDTNTLLLMEYIHNTYPEAKVLVFSMNSESIYAKRFLTAGAKGFINKVAPLDEIIKAINLVLSGKKYISDTLVEALAEQGSRMGKTNLFDTLSPREFEITTLLLAGEGISQIANKLNLQVSTVGTHKARIFEKLKVSNLIELKELATSFNI
ncbi:MAG: response regulator transcription factor [Ferruginibacter sp.]